MKPAELLERLRADRKIEVQVGHITFTGQCPLYSRLIRIINEYSGDKTISPDAVMASIAITGWEGVTERDIIPDGDPDILVPFDQTLYNELVMDRMDWWLNISKAITKSAFDRQVVKEAEIKNSPAGTTTKPSRKSQGQRQS